MSSKLTLLNCCFMWRFHALFSISILTCDWFNVLHTPLQEVERQWITRVKRSECSRFFHIFWSFFKILCETLLENTLKKILKEYSWLTTMINLNGFKPIRFIKREKLQQWNIDIAKRTLQHPQVTLICNVQCVLSIRELLRQEFEGRKPFRIELMRKLKRLWSNAWWNLIN